MARAGHLQLLANGDDFSRPGHVLPLRAASGGVLERARMTEAAVELTQISNRGATAVISALVSDDEATVTASYVERFAARHDLAMVTIPALVRYRRQQLVGNRSQVQPGKAGTIWASAAT